MYTYLSSLYYVIIICSLDVNECLEDNGGCDQECNNTIGSFFCTCGGGYTLDSDGLSCNGIIYIIICKHI